MGVYFSPDFFSKNFSHDGILEQTTIDFINIIRLGIVLCAIGLLISIFKPDFFKLLQLKVCNKKYALPFLFLILLVDFAFIVLHFINFYTPYLNDILFDLGVDRGYSEIYQYIKWLLIIILLINLSKIRRSLSYAAWGLFFSYFLLDDSLAIHERVGAYFAQNFNFIPPFGLRLQDIGELAITATVGIFLLTLLVLVYLNGQQAFKKFSQDLAILILVLVLFGVGVDMAHIMIKLGQQVDFILGAIEDGGEMLAASLILWYVYLVCLQNKVDTFS